MVEHEVSVRLALAGLGPLDALRVDVVAPQRLALSAGGVAGREHELWILLALPVPRPLATAVVLVLARGERGVILVGLGLAQVARLHAARLHPPVVGLALACNGRGQGQRAGSVVPQLASLAA